jgi:putative RNA 2'-phosphotransferase
VVQPHAAPRRDDRRLDRAAVDLGEGLVRGAADLAAERGEAATRGEEHDAAALAAVQRGPGLVGEAGELLVDRRLRQAQAAARGDRRRAGGLPHGREDGMDPVRTSKRLSWLLRHGANEVGLPMDAAGWAAVADVLRHARIDRALLERVVSENDKGRLELDGDRVRACQGHSTAGTPVTAEALEASWERIADRTEPLFHGTSRAVVDAILREGLRPMDRTHVHLAGGRADKVGKRYRVEVLLPVCPVRLAAAGIGLFRSPNGVFLVRSVPPGCLLPAEPA